MRTIIINGANGYVAANFINKLLLQDYKVIALVRANKKYTARERMDNALSEINNGTCLQTNNLKVYDYSLLDENFALSNQQLETIFEGKVDYFHFAASLKFDSKSKDEIFKINLEGLENSIRIYSRYSNKDARFFFISTAYSCGKFSGLFEEKFYENADIAEFRNYYEQSKRFAENILKQHMENHGLKAHIIRLSQVVGNNQTGVTKTDYGIFDFAKRIHNIAQKHPNETVRVHVDPDATQNLIPIDTVVDQLMRLVDVENLPTILNFVAKKATKNSYIINSLNELLPLNIIPLKKLDRNDMSALERIISVGMSFTGSYIDTNIAFDTQKRDEVMFSSNGEVTEQSVFKMLRYFINDLSGKKTRNNCFLHTK